MMKSLVSKISSSRRSNFEGSSSTQEQFHRIEMKDLVQDLGLSKKQLEVPAIRLNEKNYLRSDIKITLYCYTKQKLLEYFTKEKNLVYCNDIKAGVSNSWAYGGHIVCWQLCRGPHDVL